MFVICFVKLHWNIFDSQLYLYAEAFDQENTILHASFWDVIHVLISFLFLIFCFLLREGRTEHITLTPIHLHNPFPFAGPVINNTSPLIASTVEFK